jgi:hypothetical protein
MTEAEEDYSNYLSQLNAQLKTLDIGVRIRLHGDKLYLRATLPPKPGSRQITDYQQEISLDIRANLAGFKLAKLEALSVWMALESGEFDWRPYLKRRAVKQKLVRDWVKEFEADYFDRRERNPKSETTYDKDYRLTFNRLAPDVPLTSERILD